HGFAKFRRNTNGGSNYITIYGDDSTANYIESNDDVNNHKNLVIRAVSRPDVSSGWGRNIYLETGKPDDLKKVVSVIAETQRVGINETNPTEALDISGNLKSSGSGEFSGNLYVNGTGIYAERLFVGPDSDRSIRTGGDDGFSLLQDDIGLSGLYVGSLAIGHSNGTLSGAMGNSKNLLVAGNTGLGTTSPTEKLDVNGRIKSNQSIDVTGLLNPSSGTSMNMAYSTEDYGLLRARDWESDEWKPIQYQAAEHIFSEGDVKIDRSLQLNGNLLSTGTGGFKQMKITPGDNQDSFN
ncbi:hypothetical protein, partial [Xanthovirga aplysinae]|uniref:hypothetical protein n=1 Tax=Xanthovirga aplysinae TaxID=2529853 RepID=UPI001CA3E984